MRLTKNNQNIFFNKVSPGDKFSYSLDFVDVAILANKSGCSVDFISGKKEAIVLEKDNGLKDKIKKLTNYLPAPKFKLFTSDAAIDAFDFHNWSDIDDIILKDPVTPDILYERKLLYNGLSNRARKAIQLALKYRRNKTKGRVIKGLRENYNIRVSLAIIKELREFTNQL